MSRPSDEVKEWLQKARNDLLSAQILTEHNPPVLDTASFHCPQSVEKLVEAQRRTDTLKNDSLAWKGLCNAWLNK